MNLLALEVSTSAVKAMIFNTITHQYEVHTEKIMDGTIDGAQQDAEKVYFKLMKVGKKLAGGRTISAIALSSTWHSLLLCDSSGKPKTPVYLWPFMGASEICNNFRQNEKFTDEFYKTTGCMVNTIYPFFKLLFLQDQGYDLSKYLIMGQGSYIFYRMTESRLVSECMASGSGLLNLETRQYDSKYLNLLGITDDQLGKVVSSNQTAELKADAAELLGIDKGIPVLTCQSDGGLNQLGSGATKSGYMTFSGGTSGALRLSLQKPVLPNTPSTWCYISPKGYLAGAATNGFCNCIDWYKSSILKNHYTYEQLESGGTITAESPYFLPFIFGERCPGWKQERRGGFLKISNHHRIQDLYSSILEGVLFNIYQCYEILKTMQQVNKIRISGGIVHSEKWLQMAADIFDFQLEIERAEHSSLLGAILLARELVNDTQHFEQYQPEIEKIVYPDKYRHKLYKERYQKYLQFY